MDKKEKYYNYVVSELIKRTYIEFRWRGRFKYPWDPEQYGNTGFGERYKNYDLKNWVPSYINSFKEYLSLQFGVSSDESELVWYRYHEELDKIMISKGQNKENRWLLPKQKRKKK